MGKIYFGLAGVLLLIAGIHLFATLPHTENGLILVAAAVLLFAVEAFVRSYFLAGIFGALTFGIGLARLIPAPHAIEPWMAAAAALLIGVATVGLFHWGKRARYNKRRDL